jgi:carboxypeptidase Taq
LIRVESDEATYNLHIMLRVEMEIGLLDGTIASRICPSCGGLACRSTSASSPTTDATRVLQDIHWSIGALRLFRDLHAGQRDFAQLWATYLRAHPDRDDQIRRGEFAPLLDWLRDEHPPARTEVQGAGDWSQRVTGSRIDPQPYLEYLERKYSADLRNRSRR